ncbi:hypothetical protein [Streptomyces flavidovirens]|uniref:Uncharacterized protein n=1 Tax=Streptomyces flavidovirens TaxID=67298 RepID=A0ABW6RN88_9ACTN
MDWKTSRFRQARANFRDVYSEPRSMWKITPPTSPPPLGYDGDENDVFWRDFPAS